jgi:hypothetical protein
MRASRETWHVPSPNRAVVIPCNCFDILESNERQWKNHPRIFRAVARVKLRPSVDDYKFLFLQDAICMHKSLVCTSFPAFSGVSAWFKLRRSKGQTVNDILGRDINRNTLNGKDPVSLKPLDHPSLTAARL